MQPYRNLIIGFVLILSLMTGLAVFSLFHLNRMSEDVEKIYNHPFAVSSAGQSIQTLVFAMHSSMKELVHSRDPEFILNKLSKIDAYEQQVLQEFDTLFQRFLGDKSSLEQTRTIFIAWKEIRDQVVELISKGRYEEAAAMTRSHGAPHVGKLLYEVDQFVSLTRTRAENFRTESQLNRDHSITVVLTISIITFALSLLIAIAVIRRISKSQKHLAQRDSLVDQHILLARLDTEGRVLEASHALCHFLSCSQSSLIRKPSYFFDDSEQTFELNHHIWETVRAGDTWEGEIRRVHKDGSTCWADSRVIPEFDQFGEFTGLMNILQDTTNKKLSITDKLTTLPNRRSFEEVMQRQLTELCPLQGAITLAIVDVDFFKRYNDAYGHPEGDKALQRIAGCLLANLRSNHDHAFRIGGEEFALIICDQNKAEAHTTLNNIREQVEALAITHEKNEISDWVTISIGAYWLPGSALLDQHQLYIEADRALYRAKANRNSIELSIHQPARIALGH